MSAVQKSKELRRTRQRKVKLSKLRKRYLDAKSAEERTKIIEKAGRVAIWLSEEEFLGPVKDQIK